MTILLALALLVAPDEAREARLGRAEALLDRNATAEALAILGPLLDELSAAGDEALLARARLQMGNARLQANEYPAALEAYGDALALARKRADRVLEGRCLVGLAFTHKNRGDYPATLQAAAEAISILDSLGERVLAARAWTVRGNAQDLTGEYRRALESYQEARARLEATKGRYFYRLLNEMAITHKNLGDYEQALALYRLALDEQVRAADRFGQAVTLLNMGVVFTHLGQHERAISHYEKALALCHELDERRGQSIVLGNLAFSWQLLGDGARASEYLERQVRLTREIGNRMSEAMAEKSLGDIAVALGDLRRARERLEAALAIQREMGARTQEAGVLVSLSDLSLREGKPAEARKQGEDALAIALEAGSPELEWRARLALARSVRGSDGESALDHLRRGATLINGVRGRVQTDAGKIGYLEERQQVFHEMVDVLEAKGRPGEALEAAEAARSRALSDLLAGREIKLRPAEGGRLADIRAAEARLRTESRAAGPSAAAELTRKRAAAEADLDARLRSLREEERELASLVVAEPLSLTEITATARRLRAAIVEYLVTEKRLFIWVVDAEGTVRSAAVGIEQARLREMVRDLHRKLNAVDPSALRNPRPVREALAGLYRLLVAPVERHLPRDPDALVYLIPHDALFLVPFAALVDDSGRYLAERHTCASAPSVSVLRYTAEKKRRALSTARPHLLALADPTVPEDARVPALPGARDEVRRIARRFPADRRTLLFGAKATEASSRRLGPGQTFLHFAVHGLVYDDRPWDSALVLAAGEGEDGWLKASEVFGLDLRADLVVLSGCSTGLGKLSGDGILGLARAFLYAGTPSLVVSQWDVSDLATAFLMDRFYQALRAGKDKARSLRRAQVLTLARYPHPALWAAFTLIGEPE